MRGPRGHRTCTAHQEALAHVAVVHHHLTKWPQVWWELRRKRGCWELTYAWVTQDDGNVDSQNCGDSKSHKCWTLPGTPDLLWGRERLRKARYIREMGWGEIFMSWPMETPGTLALFFFPEDWRSWLSAHWGHQHIPVAKARDTFELVQGLGVEDVLSLVARWWDMPWAPVGHDLFLRVVREGYKRHCPVVHLWSTMLCLLPVLLDKCQLVFWFPKNGKNPGLWVKKGRLGQSTEGQALRLQESCKVHLDSQMSCRLSRICPPGLGPWTLYVLSYLNSQTLWIWPCAGQC